MTNASLKKFVSSAPSSPGIYMFKAGGRNIYTGKAANLKSRLRSYLHSRQAGLKTTEFLDGLKHRQETTPRNPRMLKMLSAADDVEFHVTDSDIEALILESQLIKNLQPRFNIMLRDDKQYFYVVFTKEKFPKIFLTHQPHATSYTLQATRHIGPFTDGAVLKSTLKFLRKILPYCTCKNPHNNFCLNYHIGRCIGFCCLKNEKCDKKVLTDYKRGIKALKEILSGKKNSLIKELKKEMMRSAKKDNLEKAIELREKLGKLKRVFENAKIIQKSSHTHISIYGYKNKKTENNLVEILHLSKIPVRIEGYDVSNIQGAHATGAMVTFVSGRPDKNFYRKFKIFRKKTADDTAMLKEILERRFKHDEWPFPDLILIDGGKGQLNAARAAISNLQFSISKKIPVIALTKNKKHVGEKIYIYGRKTPLALNKLSAQDRNLVLAIDAEAHRFAINYYRKLHRRNLKAAV